MIRVWCFFLSLLINGGLFSQSSYDPTLATKENIHKGMQKIGRLAHDNRDSAFAALKQIRTLIETVGSDSLMAKTYMIEANAAAFGGEFEEALSLIDTFYNIAKKNHDDLFRKTYLYYKARFLGYNNQKDSALVYLFEYRDILNGT